MYMANYTIGEIESAPAVARAVSPKCTHSDQKQMNPRPHTESAKTVNTEATCAYSENIDPRITTSSRKRGGRGRRIPSR